MRSLTLRRLALVLCCSGLAACSSMKQVLPHLGAQPATEASPAPRVKAAYALRVEASGEARELLLQHLDLARFQNISEDDQLSPVELDRLAAVAPDQARSLLETLGYVNAKISVSRSSDADGKQLLVLGVEPGPRTLVSAFDLNVAGALAEPDADQQTAASALRDEVRRSWPLQVGQPFSQAQWTAGKTQLLARVRSLGYPLAHLEESQADIEAADNQARLTLSLDSGPLFRLGALQIEGLEFQDEASVSRLAGFKPGQPYTEQLLLDYQERILRTQLFDGVTVDIPPEAELAAAVPVRVRVKESVRQQATTGVGYSTQDGFNTSLEHLHRRPFDLPLRAHSKFKYGQSKRSAEVELSSHPQPDMQRNIGSLKWEQKLDPGVDTRTLNARLGRLREDGRDERRTYLELLHSYEGSNNSEVRSDALSANVEWTQRRVDSTLLPTRGYTALLHLGAGMARSTVADNGPFTRAELRLAWYRPMGGDWYASARSELGQILARDGVGIPNTLLYQAGGDDSVRGYGLNTLGPPTGNGVAIGGTRLWTGSVEMAHPLSASLPMLWGAGFIDAGNAANSWRALRPVLGYGVGLRVRSPVGALRLDLARAQQTGGWRVHFSVGVAL